MRPKIYKLIVSVSGIVLIGKILGFIKQIATANAFGATIETDLISLSEGFIANTEYLLVQTLITTLVPVYLYTKNRNTEDSKTLAADTLRAFLIISAIIAAVIAMLSPLVAKVLAPSYSAQLSNRLGVYLAVFAPGLLLYIVIAISTALLNANEKFVPGQLTGFNQSAILIVLIFLFRKVLGVQTLVLGFFVCNIWNSLFLAFQAKRYIGRSKGNPFHNQDVRRLFAMMGPLLFGYAMVFINQQVDKILVSGLEPGTVTAMGYGSVTSNLVTTFIGTFGSIFFTYITKSIVSQNHKASAELIIHVTVIVVMVFLPLSILTVLCSNDIITILFSRGAFNRTAVTGAAYALTGYGLSFVPFVLRDLFSRFQYGYQDSKSPMISASVGIACNIILSVALCPRLGVFGVTFASSVSVLIAGLLNMFSAKKHNPYLRYLPLLRQLPLIALGGIVCAAAAKWGLFFLAGCSVFIRFPLVVLSSGLIYLCVVSPVAFRYLKKWRRRDSPNVNA